MVDAETKCEHCKEWTSATKHFCTHCGKILDEKWKKDEETRLNQSFTWMLVHIDPNDPPITRFFKHILRGAQIVYMAFLSFMFWFISVVAS